jgi:metallophosphoesterase superfamily enzyme
LDYGISPGLNKKSQNCPFSDLEGEKVLIMPAIRREISGWWVKKNAEASKINLACFDAKQQV